MPKIQSIRTRRRNGEPIASIARNENVSEPTVRKYLKVDDLSAKPPVRKRRGSVIDEWTPVIEGMLAEDRETWHKQRHTATRIHERLRDEYGADVSLSTVTREVARLKRESALERETGFLDLSWHPGECQADFGQVDVRWRGSTVRMRHFVLDFPHSNISPCQLMPGENAECTCQALENLFEWLGGVPRRIVYDNAAGVGRRTSDAIRLSRLFQAFQAHYGFEYAFCNPYSGHEKGAVEARVGAVRRRLFVPVPSVWNLDNFNRRLPDRCLEIGDKEHYRKGESQTGLFAEDRKALLPLPAKRFDVVTWKRMKADKHGNVILEGRHRYAAGPEHAGREMIVGMRALEVEILDAGGAHVTAHPRAYGDKPTDSGDPSSQLGLLCDRPAAWPNSRVRDALPDPLREWIDAQDEATRRDSLRALLHADRESGWQAAVAGMPEILEATGGTDRAGVCLAAARRASGMTPVAYDDPIDPGEYDIAYTKEDA
ncbi:IS21 family transposase [Bifidobacterium leontopitheci]|nr:IS21 family transposase [Bifidobacterium leontopitheci]